MSLDTYICLCNYHHHNQDRERFHHPKKFPQALRSQFPPIHPQFQAATELLCATIRLEVGVYFICVRLVLLRVSVRGISVACISVLLLSSIPLYDYNYSWLSILLVVDIWAISSLGLLWIKWLWTFIYKSLCEHVISCLLNKYIGVELWICMVNTCFDSVRYCQLFSRVMICTISHSYQQCMRVLLHYCQYLMLSI